MEEHVGRHSSVTPAHHQLEVAPHWHLGEHPSERRRQSEAVYRWRLWLRAGENAIILDIFLTNRFFYIGAHSRHAIPLA